MLPKKLFVAYDGSDPSKRALHVAEGFCRANPEVEMVLAHIIVLDLSRSGAVAMTDLIVAESDAAEAELNQLAADVPNKTEVLILKGTSPADLIVNYAQSEGCDLIVMGSRGMGGVRGYLGSVSRRVTIESPIDVYIAKDSNDD